MACLLDGTVSSSTATPIFDKTPLPRNARPISRSSGLLSASHIHLSCLSSGGTTKHRVARNSVEVCAAMPTVHGLNNTCFLGSGVAASISFVIIWDTRHKSKRRRASGRFSCECSQDCSISREASIPSWRGPASTLSFRILQTVFCSHHIKKLGLSRGLGGCFAGVFWGLFAFQRLILEHGTM